MSQPPQPPFPGEPQPGPAQPPQGQPLPGQPPYPPGYGPPAYGQPTYGPPGYGQPTDGPPGYGPPGYGPPGYGPPGYGPPGFPPPDQPPKAKNRTLPIVLTSIAIFLVLCLGGGTAIVLVARNQGLDKVTATDPTPTTTRDGATEKPPTPRSGNVRIIEPKTLGGRPSLRTQGLDSIADQLKSGLSSYPTATKSVGGLYGKVGETNIVMMTAAEATIDSPEPTVDGLLASGGSTLAVTGITSASTGSLGGAAKCGRSSAGGQRLAICAWADDGSIGLVLFFFKSVSAAKAEFPKVRAEIEKKS